MLKFYVYKHTDPRTGELVYIGQGSGGRAWQCGSSHSPVRSEEHKDWGDALGLEGFTSDQWVEIIKRGLSKEAAIIKERTLIRELRPRFNKIQGLKLLKMNKEILDKAFELRQLGLSYQSIAAEVGLAPMTVHRAMAGKSPVLEMTLGRNK